MNPDDFRAPQAGKVIRIPKGYYAFIPSDLPPDLVFDARLVTALSQADAALSELSGSAGISTFALFALLFLVLS